MLAKYGDEIGVVATGLTSYFCANGGYDDKAVVAGGVVALSCVAAKFTNKVMNDSDFLGMQGDVREAQNRLRALGKYNARTREAIEKLEKKVIVKSFAICAIFCAVAVASHIALDKEVNGDVSDVSNIRSEQQYVQAL